MPPENIPEAPRAYDPEVAQLIAERNLRQQHKYTLHWGKADQADENMWTRHDNNQGLHGEPLEHNMPYGICTVCDYLRGQLNAHD